MGVPDSVYLFCNFILGGLCTCFLHVLFVWVSALRDTFRGNLIVRRLGGKWEEGGGGDGDGEAKGKKGGTC